MKRGGGRRGRLKMSDIARLAGVSESTVSRALRDSQLVNEQTKERIRAIARDHNYQVNESARNLRLGRVQTIAVLIPLPSSSRQHISDPFFLDLLGSIADAVVDFGYDLLLSRPFDADWSGRFLESGRAEGMIVIGQAGYHEIIQDMASRHVPVVAWGARLEGQLYVSVGSDNYSGAFRAVSHLIGLGRRRIAFLGDATLPEIDLRHAGYCKALEDFDIEFDPALYIPTEFTMDAAVESVKRLLSLDPPIDGIMASSDVIAMSAIQTLHGAGRRVPDDVSVVGYDDVRMAATYSPALTTVRQDIAAGGRKLVELLLDRIQGEHVESVTLPTELVVRRSCGGLQE